MRKVTRGDQSQFLEGPLRGLGLRTAPGLEITKQLLNPKRNMQTANFKNPKNNDFGHHFFGPENSVFAKKNYFLGSV